MALTPTARMKQQLVNTVYPWLEQNGFILQLHNLEKYPHLKTARNFRRLTKAYIHFINFQYSNDKSAFCINLGVGSLDALDYYFLRRGIDIEDMTGSDFPYSARLSPIVGQSDTWWQYRDLGYVGSAHRYFGADEDCYEKIARDVMQIMAQRLDEQLVALEKQVKY